MKFTSFTMLILWACLSYGQNVGIGTASPGTKLDVNGALTYRETVVSVSSNTATIPSNVSQVQLTGTATATIIITPPTPPNAGQVLVVYNNTTGGYGATIGSTTIPAGTALELVYSAGAWVATDPEAAGTSSYYIQNQTSASQSGAGFNTAGSGTIAGTLTLTPMTSGSVLFAGASGVVSQKNADLFWDNTNYRLGIGTASPSAPLHVVSAATTSLPISLLLGLQPSLATGNSVYEKLGVALTTANEVDMVFNYVNASTTTSTANSSSNNFGIGFYGVSPVATFYPNGNVLVPKLAGTSARPVYADASGDLNTGSNLGYSSSNKATFTYSTSSGTGVSGIPSTGATWTIPSGVTMAFVKLWGAGGGGNTSGGSAGGGGGYISGWLTWPSSTTSLTIIVGGGGGLGNPNGSGGSNGGGSSSYQGGGGGGRSCIQVSGTDYVAAGGGGGSIDGCYCRGGGAGGGGQGLTGFYATANGQSSGGTQTGVGNSAGGSTAASGHNGGSHPGGSSYSYGGGGGGGWYGGGAGGYNSANGNDGAGSGGSSGGNSTYFAFTWGEAGQMYFSTNTPTGPIFPGGMGDIDYTYGVGFGGMPTTNSNFPTNTAGNGYVVIYW